MSKFKNWAEHPITRGDYLTACGASLLLTAAFYAIATGVPQRVVEKVKELKEEKDYSNWEEE